jgi:U3 small nucleolar RNA-associated protein 25
LLHIVNHVLTSRDRIQRNSRQIKSMSEEADEIEDEAWKDQGFTRPTILVLLPTRDSCYKFLKQMINLLDGNVPENFMDRFEAEYGAPVDDGGEEGEAEKRRRKKVLEDKGISWQELFGDEVNDDDDFKIGISLSSKSSGVSKGKGKERKHKDSAAGEMSLKLYADFYSSDIIVASPLGLKMALSSENDRDSDSDFLSSIEICYVGRADVLLMQNWDHVNDVLDSLNLLPKSNNETDFSRVRNYFLVDQAAHWRQIIFSSDFLDPAILSTFKRFAKSHSGTLKMRRRIPEDEGSIANVIVPIRQVFQRVPTHSVSSQSDDRMKYLTQKVLPPILQQKQKHTMIYTPSYFDYVLLRNFLIKREAEFVSVTEYSRVSETSRGRARFLQGRKPLMLYTGRAHFFLRHKIKGVRHLILFGLPEHSDFYPGLANIINEGLEGADAEMGTDEYISSLALFTKYEAHALERIVGTSLSNRMVKGEKSTFVFVS